MNSEVEIAIKEYYDLNEKIKLLEKRKSELKEILNSVFESKKTNELKAEDILIYRVNRPRISWDESVIKSILTPKGLWESVLGFDNKKVKNLIKNHVISEKEIEGAKITVDTWYTYTEQVPNEQDIKPSSNLQSNEEIKGIKRVVITDLSRMKEDRVCIFGFDEKKKPIRPVIPHIGIHEGYIFDNEKKQIIKPFAEVEFEFIRPLPERPHMEDLEINTDYEPKLIRNLSENESERFLEEILDESVNAIFGETIQNHRYIIKGGNRSIGTIRIKEALSVNYSIKQDDKYDYRITFADMNGDIYNLPITDLAFRKHCDNQRFQGIKIDQINHDLKEIFNQCDLFLRVGLSRRWQGFYWLLVSGVYSFPDYLGKEDDNKVQQFEIQNNICIQKMNFDKEVEILSNDINSSHRAHASYLLGECKNPAFVEILCKATKDPDGNVRRMAASALGKIGDTHAIDALIYLLYDNKPQVRQYAIKALGDIGNERAIPELMKFKDDPIPYINKAIDTAIKKIKKFRADLCPINVENENFDPDLFEILRCLRKEVADKEGVSPFIIFYDISLKAMATHFPKDLKTLGTIEGVDEINLRKYGELFLEEIINYCKNHTIEPKAINALGSNPKSTTIMMQTPTSSKPERVSADIFRVSMSKRDMIGTLKKIIIELHQNKEAAPLEEIISKAESIGIERDAVKEVIQQLKWTGEIYEVSNEQFRII
ncbi:MAG: HEAT repeat domain-containing protein [Candidatus Methanoperedens sp.]